MKYFTVYKTTNLLNGKIYIGKHITKNLDDDYLGSGKILRNAIAKYGRENFKKEILFVFDNIREMNCAEKALVDETFCENELTYNLCVGGQGDFSYINKNRLAVNNLSNDDRLKGSMIASLTEKEYLIDPDKKKSWKQEISSSLKSHISENGHWSIGRKHTDDSKNKMKNLNNHKGEKNSQFGTMWISDGIVNKKIKKDDPIPDGFRKGRILE